MEDRFITHLLFDGVVGAVDVVVVVLVVVVVDAVDWELLLPGVFLLLECLGKIVCLPKTMCLSKLLEMF